ncbi:GNAT family N-acetyltransferase [Lacticaseibacillus zhaodongensis]|uniref:GNAT family N-acetyltransferase n=1 Tax=Lacticaseibacillus zhaodongensis TaxID=2668065 RepID=UPI0012D33F4C|nr:GNAT family N-acetyltransferase [Lacticaseibacillus zhaodongensis]
MNIKVSNDLDSAVHQDSVQIREAVFVEEQHVPSALEVDADEGKATYFTGYDAAGQPLATLRLLREDYGFHVQRVAVVKAARGKGYGREMIQAAIDYGKQQHVQKLMLGAQVHATGFYERLGFSMTAKPEFLDAGIRHREMELVY